MKPGILALRLVVGGLFIGHGLQKLRGAFGGPGLEGTEKMTKSIGLEPAKLNARAVALTETVGGAAIAVGAATPYAAAGLIATMVTAVRKVHFKNGLWNSKGGYEFNAVLVAALAAIADQGPGPVSIDAIRGRSRGGVLMMLLALGGGIAGSFAVTEFAKRAKPAEAEEAGEAEAE